MPPVSACDRWLRVGLTVFVVLMICAPPIQMAAVDPPTKEFNDVPDVLRPYVMQLHQGGTTDRVLNLERLALAAMRSGHREIAKSAFDRVLDRIEDLYVDSETAAKVRSKWYEEGCKAFIGEPYERAFAYLYRGILHMEDAEYDEARACFRSGILQDAFAEDKQFRCDFALLVYLYGVCCRVLDDEMGAEEAFTEAAALMPKLNLKSRKSTKYLVIAETGTAPRKISDGLGHGELKYGRGKSVTAYHVRIKRGTSHRESTIYENAYFQASTRGGRAVDKIIEGKILFQQRTAVSGKVLDRTGDAVELVGLIQDNADVVQAAGALNVIGGIVQLIAARAKPHADIRYWDNLPDKIYAFELPASAEKKPYTLQYFDDTGRELTGIAGEITINVPCNSGLCIKYFPSPSYSIREDNS